MIHNHHIFNSATNRDFTHPVTGESFPNIQFQLRGKFEELYGAAAIDLKVAMSELVVAQRKKASEKTTNYTMHVQGNVAALQHGPNNTQNLTTGIQFRNGKLYIRWSQLKPEVGIQRVSEIGDVEVTELDIQQAKEIGGDPWGRIHEASTMGLSVERYALGQFTPA